MKEQSYTYVEKTQYCGGCKKVKGVTNFYPWLVAGLYSVYCKTCSPNRKKDEELNKWARINAKRRKANDPE